MKDQQTRHWRLCALVIGAVLGQLAACCFGTRGETIGSPLIRRQYADIDFGQVYIYNGTRGRFQTPGKVSSWAFFDDRNAGRSVTPLLFKITGKDVFSLTGIGKSRVSAGTGLQRFPFEVIAGRAEVRPGEYTFGFANRAYVWDGTNLLAGSPNTGVVGIDRPSASIPNDPWVVTAQISSDGPVALQIGTKIGAGGIRIYNSIDPCGLDRVYSAQATVVSEANSFAPEPSPITVISSLASGGNFRFGFQTLDGWSYTVWRTTNLATADWVFWTNFIADGSPMGFLVPVAEGPQQFFRVTQP